MKLRSQEVKGVSEAAALELTPMVWLHSSRRSPLSVLPPTRHTRGQAGPQPHAIATLALVPKLRQWHGHKERSPLLSKSKGPYVHQPTRAGPQCPQLARLEARKNHDHVTQGADLRVSLVPCLANIIQ